MAETARGREGEEPEKAPGRTSPADAEELAAERAKPERGPRPEPGEAIEGHRDNGDAWEAEPNPLAESPVEPDQGPTS